MLDQDVDATLVGVLVGAGHQAWTIASAGIPDAQDDDVSIYAATMKAVVVTHDREFSTRRRRNPHGRHVQLGCTEPDAVEVVSIHLTQLVAAIDPFDDVFVYLSKQGISVHHEWT